MAYVLEKSYTATAAVVDRVYGDEHLGAVFTTGNAFDLTKVEMYLGREATALVDDPYVRVFATSDGKPTGAELGSVVLDRTRIPQSQTWIDVEFAVPIPLAATTAYAIILDPIGNTSTSEILVCGGVVASGGTAVKSTNDGATWSILSNYHVAYRAYSGGEADYVDVAGSAVGTSAAEGTLNVTEMLNIAGSAVGITATNGRLVVAGFPGGTSYTPSVKPRIVAIANNSLYYEDV